jgi:hypothetical protein
MRQLSVKKDSVNVAPDFDASGTWRYSVTATMWTTVIAGVVTALAPAIPLSIRFPLLVVALIAWLVSIVWLAPGAVRGFWQSWKSVDSKGPILVGTAGILVASVAIVQPLLVRIWWGRPALTWNIDHRYALNLAQAIARTGGVNQALDFAGIPLGYHVASAWLAGAFARVFDSGMTEMLFGVIPLLCVLSAALGIYCLLRQLDLPTPYAVLAAGVSLTVPAENLWLLASQAPGRLLNPETWLFSCHLIYNSLMGLSVGLCSCVLLVRRTSGFFGLLAGAAGLASVVEIKPQYFIGFGLFIGVLSLWRLHDTDRTFARRTRLLFAASLALVLGVWMRSSFPGKENVFGAPVMRDPLIARRAAGYEVVQPYGVFLIAGLLVSYFRERKLTIPRPRKVGPTEIVLAAGVAYAALLGFLMFFTFPVRPEIVQRSLYLEVGSNPRSEVYNLLQVLVPLRLLLTAGACGTLLWLVAPSVRRSRMIVLVFIALMVLLPVPYISYGFVYPDKGYEAADEPDLYYILQRVDLGGELLISSDLGDPAEDYSRPLRAIDLTAYGGRQFYLSDVSYMHWVRPEAAERLDNVKAFFQSAWSDWHTSWLKTAGITHVLIHDRCVPSWSNDPQVPLQLLKTQGGWQLFQVGPLRDVSDPAARPEPVPIVQKYGRAACLGGDLLPETRQ